MNSEILQLLQTILTIVALALMRRWTTGSVTTINKQVAHQVSEAVKGTTQQASEATTGAIDNLSEKLTGILQQQGESRHITETYLIEANTSLRLDRDEQKFKSNKQAQEIIELTVRLNTYVETVEGLLKSQESKAQANRERDQRIELLSEKVAAMGSALSGTEKTLEKAQGDLRETQNKLKVAEDRLAELEHEGDKKQKAHEAEKQELIESLTTEHEKAERLERRVKELETQVTELKTQLDAQKINESPSPFEGRARNAEALVVSLNQQLADLTLMVTPPPVGGSPEVQP